MQSFDFYYKLGFKNQSLSWGANPYKLYLPPEAKEALSQREISEKTGYGLGTINKVVKELTDNAYLDAGVITEEEFTAKKRQILGI